MTFLSNYQLEGVAAKKTALKQKIFQAMQKYNNILIVI